MILPVILSVLIGLAHYASDRLCIICSTIRKQLISLIAGISTVYVFVNLFPEFYKASRPFNPLIFTSVFLGFAIFYLVDKEIYQKIRHKQVPHDIRLAHGYGLTIYYFVVGIALVKLLSLSTKGGILFFIPIFIYSGLSTLSSHGIHGMHGPHYKSILHLNVIQTISVIVGTLIALFLMIPDFLLIYLIGFVAGILTYIIIRDILPKGKKGEPLFFILGAFIYLVLIIALWFV